MLGDLLDDLLKRSVRVLEAAKVQYAAIGGIAMIAAGRDRTTRDMDVIVSAMPEELGPASLAEGFRHDPVRDRHSIQGITLRRYWTSIAETGLEWSLDVQQSPGPLYASVLERAFAREIGGLSIRLATPEDLILLKLIAFRPLDRADCVNLVSLYPELDQGYIENWVSRLDVQKRWDEVVQVAADLEKDGF